MIVNVVGCEGCTIRVANSVKGREGSAEGTVSQGKAIIDVPISSTPGLTFAVAHPSGFSVGGKSPIAIVGYPDIPVGSSLSTANAAQQRRGSVCWGGTTQAAVNVRLLVEIEKDQMRVRLSPTNEVIGRVVELTNGAYGSNEVPDCSTL